MFNLSLSQIMFCIIRILFIYMLQTLWQYEVDLNSPNVPFNAGLEINFFTW